MHPITSVQGFDIILLTKQNKTVSCQNKNKTAVFQKPILGYDKHQHVSSQFEINVVYCRPLRFSSSDDEKQSILNIYRVAAFLLQFNPQSYTKGENLNLIEF